MIVSLMSKEVMLEVWIQLDNEFFFLSVQRENTSGAGVAEAYSEVTPAVM